MSKGLEALCYLDDIAHGRKMNLDAHELKLTIEKDLEVLEIIKYLFKDFIELNEFKLPHVGKVHYEIRIYNKVIYLSKEKYDLLKERLEND